MHHGQSRGKRNTHKICKKQVKMHHGLRGDARPCEPIRYVLQSKQSNWLPWLIRGKNVHKYDCFACTKSLVRWITLLEPKKWQVVDIVGHKFTDYQTESYSSTQIHSLAPRLGLRARYSAFLKYNFINAGARKHRWTQIRSLPHKQTAQCQRDWLRDKETKTARQTDPSRHTYAHILYNIPY